MKLELSLPNLKELDFGKVDLAFRQHLQRAVEDCMDRPGDDTAREVRIAFKLAPARTQTAECDAVNMYCQVTSRVPAHRSATFNCQPRKGGHLLFDAESPEDFQQQAFSDLENHNASGADRHDNE